MIRKILIGVGIVILALGIFVVYISLTTKCHSPEEIAKYESDGLNIEVKYSRPFKKDRLIFGLKEEEALVPFGEIWRTGANEATEIKISNSILFGKTKVSPGTYSIYTIPGPDNWTVVLNERTGYWGASMTGNPFKEEFDIARAQATTSDLETSAEQFGIALEEIGSDTVRMTFTFDKTQSAIYLTH